MKNHAKNEQEAETFLLFYIETEKELILKYANEQNVTLPKTAHNIEVLEEKLRSQTVSLSIAKKELLMKKIIFLEALKILDLGVLTIMLGYLFYNDSVYFSSIKNSLCSGSICIFITEVACQIIKCLDEIIRNPKLELDDILKYQLFYQNEEYLKNNEKTRTYNAVHQLSYKKLKKELHKAKKEKV